MKKPNFTGSLLRNSEGLGDSLVMRKWIRHGLTLASPVLSAACSHDLAPPAASPPTPAPPPFYVAGGAGSEHGNFPSHPDVETIGPGGVHCVIYVWDRPLTAQTALRLRSSSCEQSDHPGMYVATELERLVIPRASSTLDQSD